MTNFKQILFDNLIRQKELAKKCKMSSVSLAYIIHGRRKVSFERKVQIVEAINRLLDKKPGPKSKGPLGSFSANRVTISDVFPDTFKKISKARTLVAIDGFQKGGEITIIPFSCNGCETAKKIRAA